MILKIRSYSFLNVSREEHQSYVENLENAKENLQGILTGSWSLHGVIERQVNQIFLVVVVYDRNLVVSLKLITK